MSRTFGFLAALSLSVPSLSAQAPEAHVVDFDQTLQARKWLLTDAQLAPLNLGVRVRDRVAVLWGPVPSKDLANRAEKKLQELIEFREVRNQLYVEEPDVRPLFLPDPPPPPAPQAPPLPAPPEPAKERLVDIVKETPGPVFQEQRGKLPAAQLTAKEEGILELPTVQIPARTPPAPVLAPVKDRLQDLQRHQERFAQVRFRVDGARVYLHAPSNQTAALHEMAQLIAQWPGIGQVILQP